MPKKKGKGGLHEGRKVPKKKKEKKKKKNKKKKKKKAANTPLRGGGSSRARQATSRGTGRISESQRKEFEPVAIAVGQAENGALLWSPLREYCEDRVGGSASI